MFDDRFPIYRQIADRIRNDVLNGTLKPEEQVMSTTQYAEFYRINPATAAKAFQQLVDEDVIYKRRGVGMFVRPGAPERLQAEFRQRFFSDVVDPMVEQARTVGIPIRDVIKRIEASANREPGGHDTREDDR
ncbi:MAG TPA: GntR family transcriptional regulator [Actinomycetota bacterium]|nr:GntR family transcriptional regulator [Actinomycetota bacterium]